MERIAVQSRHRLLALVGLAALVAAGVPLWQADGRAKEPASSRAARQNANQLSEAFRAAAEEAVPTVVTIETHTKPHAVSSNGQRGPRITQRGENPFKGTPFEDFFNNDEPMPFHFGPFSGDRNGHTSRTPQREGMASGVIVDSSGIVLTNNHVVAGADEVTVTLSDGREFKANDIKTDPETDLAVLRISGAGTLPAARFGDSDDLRLGDWVIAVGNPFGLDSTVSSGIISGTGRGLSSAKRTRFLQTDAAINPGNSGGPLVNLEGEVIGINTAIATSSGGYQGVGFAIPSNMAKWVVSQLVEKGVVERAYLGVVIQEVKGQMAEKFGIARHDGVAVAEVQPKSPAAAAGFQEGDVITEYGGKAVRSPGELQEKVERTPAGGREDITVLRDGKPLHLQVVVKPLPSNAVAGSKVGGDSLDRGNGRGTNDSRGYKSNDLGMEVGELTSDIAGQLGFTDYKGVIVTGVDEDGLAARAGLREGMLVLKVGQKRVENVAEFEAALEHASPDEGVMLLVRADNVNHFVLLQQR
jgi:serine protease Do